MKTNQYLAGFLCLLLLSGVSACSSNSITERQSTSSVQIPFTSIPPAPPTKTKKTPKINPFNHKSKDSLTFSLSPGWNTISFPFNIVTATSGFADFLFWFENGEYKILDPNVHPEQIVTSRGYWIYSETGGAVSATGSWSVGNASVPLKKGWNLFSFICRSAKPFSQAVITLGSESKPLTQAGTFDITNGAGGWAYARIYEYRDNAWQRQTMTVDSNQFIPWHGYWIWSWVDATLNFSTSSPTPTPTIPPPPPSVDGLTPSSGSVGSSVTIAGTIFGSQQGTSTVTFNGVNAGTASSWAGNRIVITVPQGATTGPVVVTVGGQASNNDMNFTVSTNPTPTPSSTPTTPTPTPTQTSTPTPAPSGMPLSIPTNLSATSGSQATVPVSVGSTAGLAGFDFAIEYNSDILRFQSVQLAQNTQGFSLKSKQVTSNTIRVVLAKAAGMPAGSGAIVNLVFSTSGTGTSILNLKNVKLVKLTNGTPSRFTDFYISNGQVVVR